MSRPLPTGDVLYCACGSALGRAPYTEGFGEISEGSSCFVCLRERCLDPATITTTIATTHHTAASSHDCLTESAPENMGEKKLPETVLFMA